MQKASTNTPLTVLGIETSCDETAAAVIRRRGRCDGEILSNVVRAQLDEHRAFGGVVPEIAARAHVEVLDALVKQALSEAGIGFDDLDAVAATAGPGLIGGLMVGLATAKAIAVARGLPLLAVNHLEGHALTVGLTEGLTPPYLLLLVSGGHTQLVMVRKEGGYMRLGTTLDDALGEAFDKTAKLLALGFPGGPEVERHAAAGDGSRFNFPRPMLGRDDPHFSFSGLKTAVRRLAQSLSPLSEQDIADLCASFQAAVCDVVVDRSATAMALYEARAGSTAPRHFVIAGGVASNKALRATVETLCARKDYMLHVAPAELCTDNGAMIAWAGAEKLARGLSDPMDFEARARWPLDPDAPAVAGAGVKA